MSEPEQEDIEKGEEEERDESIGARRDASQYGQPQNPQPIKPNDEREDV